MSRLLTKAMFQIAYVTSDLPAALAHYQELYDIGPFMTFDSASTNSAGPPLLVGLAWIGDIMIELMQSTGHEPNLYDMNFSAGRPPIQHHHVGHLLACDEEWDALHAELQARALPIVFEQTIPGFMKLLYADFRATDGHFREYVHLADAGRQMFEAIPRY